MTRRLTDNAAYLRLLRSTRSGAPTFREFDSDLQRARTLDTAARLDASAIRGF